MLGLKLNHVSKRGHRRVNRPPWVNSLAPERFQRNFRKVNFQLILVIDGWSVSCKVVLKWMPVDLTDGKSTLVQDMAWCRQATSHNLSQYWPRSLTPYGVMRPQWWPSLMMHIFVTQPQCVKWLSFAYHASTYRVDSRFAPSQWVQA